MVEFEYAIISFTKLLHKSRYGKVVGSISGDVTVNIIELPTGINEDKFGEDVNIALGIYVLSGGLLVRSSGLRFVINTGSDYVELEFTREHLLAVNTTIPINIKKINLEDLPIVTDVKGVISLDINFEITFFPNLRLITSKASRQAIRAGKYAAKSAVIKGGKGLKFATKYGINAFHKTTMALLNSLAKKIAKKALLNGLTQSAALRSILAGWAKWIGRGIGAAGIYLDAYIIVQEQARTQVLLRGNETHAFLASGFRTGYAKMLVDMTRPSSLITEQPFFFDKTGNIQRLTEDSPNLLNTFEALVETGELIAPKSSVYNWRKTIENQGPKFQIFKLKLIELNYQDLIVEAFSSYWVFEPYKKSSSSKSQNVADKMIDHARKLSVAAGQIAAYQDIYTFLLATKGYPDAKGMIDYEKIWEDWDDIIVMHSSIYGADTNSRYFKYLELAEKSKSYYPKVLPFR